MWMFTLKPHKNFTDNLPKENERSSEKWQVLGLIIWSIKLYMHKLFKRDFW